MSQTAVPEPGELAAELQSIVKTGLVPQAMGKLPHLRQLGLVAVEAAGDSDIDVALAIARVITQAADGLGDGPSAEATRLILGIDERTRGLRLEDRRALASDMIGVASETWRKNWEGPVVMALAVELYQAEQQARVVVHIRPPKRPSGTLIADLAHGSKGKDLQRREDEARLFALGYELRAELFAATRIRSRDPDGEVWRDHARQALWLFADFADAMADFSTAYGTALVMAGNEVTAREAAAVLGFRPAVSDEDIGLLRLVWRTIVPPDASSLVSALRARPSGEGYALWERWIASIPVQEFGNSSSDSK